MVNMLSFQYGSVGYEFIRPELSPIDKIAHSLIELFFQGSFYPIYAILFGFGAVMIYENAQARGQSFYRLYSRRLLILMAFGFIHLYFIWDGDILLNYALSGFIFIFFIKRKAKSLLKLGIILAVLINLPGLLPQETGENDDLAYYSYMEKEREALSSGSYSQVLSHRFNDSPYDDLYADENLLPDEQEALVTIVSLFSIFMIMMQTFMLFLIGAYIAKSRWLHDPLKHLPVLKKVFIFAFPIGIFLKAGMVFTTNESFDYLGYFLGGPLLALAYISLVTILFTHTRETRITRGFAYAGRMALTNYLLQSIVMTSIFYGYGLGMFGKLGVTIGSLLALLFFILQAFYSKKWFKHFQYGPMEAFWRLGTYLRPQKMRK